MQMKVIELAALIKALYLVTCHADGLVCNQVCPHNFVKPSCFVYLLQIVLSIEQSMDKTVSILVVLMLLFGTVFVVFFSAVQVIIIMICSCPFLQWIYWLISLLYELKVAEFLINR